MKKFYLLLVCFGVVLNAKAAENNTTKLTLLQDKVNRAIIKFENTDKTLWSYTVSRYENEEGDISSSVEQHSPHSNQQWTLKRINGQQPTEKQIKQFVKNKKKRNNNDKQGKNIQFPLRKLIKPESLSFVSNDDKSIVLAFDVHLERLGKDSIGKLTGKLIYQKQKQFIEKITIWNNADFSPMLTANITDLIMSFTFLDINGAVLIKQNKLEMKGSFAYFTRINETSQDEFSDYVYLGE